MNKELDIAIHAAHRAGVLVQSRFGTRMEVQHKGPIDIVTEMDRAAEDLIREELGRAFPSHAFVGEESGGLPEPDNSHWLVDPIDGTTNYARGYPFYCVSIALQKDGHTVLGVVYNPTLDETFWAERGQGAWLNGERIRVSTTDHLAQSLLASGFPYSAQSSEIDNGREWCHFLKRVTSLRSDGSAALDLCHVAAGRLDGYWELDLNPWDMAAGALIVQEAGGIATQVNGSPYHAYGKNVMASNGRIHDAMVAILGS